MQEMECPVFTWGIRQEAAGVELQLLHKAQLAIVTETVEVPLTQNEDGGGGVGEGGHREVKGLFSQDKGPVRLEGNKHTHSVSTLPTLQNRHDVYQSATNIKLPA